MKKIIVSLAVIMTACLVSYAAMYSFTFTIVGIEDSPAYDHLTADTKYTLYDSNNKIVAYATTEEWNKTSSKTQTSFSHPGDANTYAHELSGLNLEAISVTTGEKKTKTVIFNLASLTTSDETLKSILSGIPIGVGTMDGWHAVVNGFMTDKDETTTTPYRREFNTIYYNNGAGTPNFQTAAGFVPEPTSGVLVLLGLAGLALRRRREA